MSAEEVTTTSQRSGGNRPLAELALTELFARARSGDHSSWEEVVRRYDGLVRATAWRFRMQEADILDVTQTTWLRLLENGHALRDPDRLPGWLTTTASRECMRILRQSGRLSHHVLEDRADPQMGPEEVFLSAETARTVRDVVGVLSSRRRILMEALLEDKPAPYAQICIRTGMPPGSVGPTRSRALRQLREELDRLGLSQTG